MAALGIEKKWNVCVWIIDYFGEWSWYFWILIKYCLIIWINIAVFHCLHLCYSALRLNAKDQVFSFKSFLKSVIFSISMFDFACNKVKINLERDKCNLY